MRATSGRTTCTTWCCGRRGIRRASRHRCARLWERLIPTWCCTASTPMITCWAADFAQQNMIATLTLLFGALGLVLAAVGLYGVTAYTVEQRTSEIGVRMALGANRGNVVSMILRDAFWQVGVGLAVGIPAAIGAGWAITTQLFGVKFWDPAMLSVAAVLLHCRR